MQITIRRRITCEVKNTVAVTLGDDSNYTGPRSQCWLVQQDIYFSQFRLAVIRVTSRRQICRRVPDHMSSVT